MIMKMALAALVLAVALPAEAGAQRRPQKPKPDLENVSYGPHKRNVLDLWKADSEEPTPLVVFIHGGGFRAGDKKGVSGAMIKRLRKEGISVAAINYRYSQQAPFPAQMHDAARAIQFLRHKARDWNLDPQRFGATGGSAGAGISLWLGFHDDLADADSEDPVRRHSTRVQCMAVNGAQVSYDPLWIKKHIGGDARKHPALAPFFGLKPEEYKTEKAQKLFDEASPITHLTRDDAPAHLNYGTMREGDIHSARFGQILKEKMDPLKIECVVVIRDRRGDGEEQPESGTDFLTRHLKKKGD